jgi:hypothetical protein
MDAQTFAVLNIVVVTMMLAALPFLDAGKRWARRYARFWAVIEILNGLFHLSGVVIFSTYVPGACMAPFLLVGGIVLVGRLRRDSFKAD